MDQDYKIAFMPSPKNKYLYSLEAYSMQLFTHSD